MKKKIIYLMLFMFIGAPALQSCSSSRSCKTSRYKKTMYQKKCWNAKKQRYTRC